MRLSQRPDAGRKAVEAGAIATVAILVGFAIGGFPELGGPSEPVRVAAGRASTPSTIGGLSSSTTATTAESSETTSPPQEATTTTAAPRQPSEVEIRLYNGSTVGGAAVKTGNRLKAAGYVILPPGPSSGPRGATSVWYQPGFQAEAAAVAGVLSLAAESVSELSDPPPVAGIGTADVIVLVGNDVASKG